jgi:CheY-like chemotaxis protein
MAEAHGGTVSVESPGRGKGSTFTVTLPIAAVAAHRADGVEAPADPQVSRPLQGVHALIVDDDPEARVLLRAILSQAGANVVSVASAPLALSELTTYRPDLIISDIAMPQMDGFTLAREIRQRPELDQVKLIALSAFPPRSTAEQEPGFDEYLTKPIDPTALVDAIVRIRSVA